MLGKMLIHGLVGAAMIASAAAVYAQAKDNGYLKPDMVQALGIQPAKPAATGEYLSQRGDGYDRGPSVHREREHGKKADHRHEGRRHHDDDDD